MNPLLIAEGLHKSYGPTTALAGADLVLHAGEILSIMGPSGSGKSTLLHCAAGLTSPDSGHITYDGRLLTEMSDVERSALRRREFGFVFQFGQLVPELTALENVALPLRLDGIRKRAAERRATGLLDRLGLAGKARSRPGELSGGQQQRVAVARALIAEPKVLFADEPTGALDSVSGEQVMEMLTRSARQSGAAVVLVTHDARIAAYADRGIVVRDGRSLDRARAR
ncbi:ABC transporter ATP-binding protein [Actinoplanes italicus]|uniref:Putative ABC transport system ATP-binding protein n=1 Tax=Actinoplanes italicus TaxID=113567 RepID=A0A2T0KGN5_9ACTN|nr:ABC transporter ATP-binding protein [Actinoplanes italicus]PRX22600.1 putative ABC transport system ATP-binding protein [Actinoplanes italicus]GIE28120.1 ABC transporter ATP-binding protein [Actinoplanes italicus]